MHYEIAKFDEMVYLSVRPNRADKIVIMSKNSNSSFVYDQKKVSGSNSNKRLSHTPESHTALKFVDGGSRGMVQILSHILQGKPPLTACFI